MNEEQLIEFVNWLPSVVPEFKDATPDQIVQALNQMSESDEGQQMLSQLINTFQQAKQSADSQMFKKGGKLAAFVSKYGKYGKGGEMCCKKKAIIQGGMVNKVAEKMQEGGDTSKLALEGRDRASSWFNSFKTRDSHIREDFNQRQKNQAESNRQTVIDNIKKAAVTSDQSRLWEHNRLLKIDPMFISSGYQSIPYIDHTIGEFNPNFVSSMQEGGDLATNTSTNTLSNFGLLTKAQEGENDTNDWFQSMILDEIPNMNFIQRRQLGPNSYVHELSATREGLANPTLGRMIETNPNTGQSDTTYVRFFMDPFTEPIFTNMTGSAKKQADSKIEGLRNKANSKGAKIRK